jgi:EAL domain-containing protein (putative c-di-GMP-specific phosphodiesterase class I)
MYDASGLSSQAAAALDAVGLPSELLIFEITENVVMKDLAGAREVMKKLDRLGVRLAIDDFGTGHSSLAYLKQFPVQGIKVDRTFVQGIVDSPVDSAIVRAVIDLANAMGISAVAEGRDRGTARRAQNARLPGGAGFLFLPTASCRGV